MGGKGGVVLLCLTVCIACFIDITYYSVFHRKGSFLLNADVILVRLSSDPIEYSLWPRMYGLEKKL